MRIFIVFLLLVGCSGEKEKIIGGAAPIGEFKTKYPRTFSGSAEYRVPNKSIVLDSSTYTRGREDSVLGCLVTDDFTIVMRNGDDDQLRIRLKKLSLAPGRTTYRGLDVALDGYSASKRFQFNSAKDTEQVGDCVASFNLVKDEMVESDLQCASVKSNKDGTRADFALHFSCDVVHP